MRKHFPLVSFAAISFLLSAGWPMLTKATEPAMRDHSPAGEVVGPLDGMTFEGMLGPDGKPKDTPDRFVFEDGTFVSKECELRCKYPARPYFVRIVGDKTEFISETQCPYKDAKIVWRGTVEGDTIRGKSTWVVKRWYWTVENTFAFEGKLANGLLSTTTDTD